MLWSADPGGRAA